MKYIALLRGINIGSKRIKMADLIKSLESMNVKNVKTYLQSGNIIFDQNSINIKEIRENIEKMIGQTFGFSVNVIIRTESELEDSINSNPFIKEDDVETDKLHVTFLQDIPDKKAVLDLGIIKVKMKNLKLMVGKFIFTCQMDILKLN